MHKKTPFADGEWVDTLDFLLTVLYSLGYKNSNFGLEGVRLKLQMK